MRVAGNTPLRWSAVLSILLLACGPGAPPDSSGQDALVVALSAGKEVFVRIDPHEELQGDSLEVSTSGDPTVFSFDSGDHRVTVSAHLVPGCGATPEDRKRYLEETGISGLSLQDVPALSDDPGFTAVLYTGSGMSVVERTWNMGSGELAILEARAPVGSPSMLLAPASVVLRTATLERSPGSVSDVYLSDRTRMEIIEQANADVTVPPDVGHLIRLQVDPAGRMIQVTDTVTVDFRTTQSDSVLSFLLPSNDSGADLTALSGTVSISGDSAFCTADSMRMFRGVFNGSWSSYASVSEDSLVWGGMQIRPSSTFQCGMWFYPGCGVPADYRLTIVFPDQGYDVYAPLTETSRRISDSILEVIHSSPEGGVMGPLAWAVGSFDRSLIAGGRSGFLSHPADSLSEEAALHAGALANVIWNGLGFTGARLDFIVVRSLEFPVFIVGPGCVFASSDVLISLGGSPDWADSLAVGVAVPETAIAAGVASALLSGSTWLSPEFSQVLSAWMVYRFAAGGDETRGAHMLEAFNRYYLYSVGATGGVEYSIADPQLAGTPLEAPVLLGKAPVVIEFLTREIPAFGNALRRALGNLRHAGDTYGRLFSSMGLPESGAYSEMFNRWIYAPGLPRLRVTWQDSTGLLDLHIQQLQPGQAFPLGSITEEVMVFSEMGEALVQLLPSTTTGLYIGELPAWMEDVTDLDLDPSRTLPADIVYVHGDLR